MKTLTSSLMDGKNYKQNKVMRIDYINAMAKEVYLEHENNDLLYGDSLRLLGGNEERFRKQVINNMYPTSEQEYQADLNAQGEAEAELARQEYEYQQMLRERANLDNMNKAQEKAKELIEFFSSVIPIEASINDTSEEAIRKMRNDWIATKQCALKVCDEVLGDMGADRGYEFWTEVKQEIKKL